MDLRSRPRRHRTRAGHIGYAGHRIDTDEECRGRVRCVGCRSDAVARLIGKIHVDVDVIQTGRSQSVGDLHHRIEALALHGQFLLDLDLDLGALGIGGMGNSRHQQQSSNQSGERAAQPSPALAQGGFKVAHVVHSGYVVHTLTCRLPWFVA